MRKKIFSVLSLTAVALTIFASSTSASSTRQSGAWQAQIKVQGTFSGFLSANHSLYAVLDSSTGPQLRGRRLIRIDPSNGRVLARSKILPGVEVPVYVGGSLWTTGVTYYSKDARHEGPRILERIDPTTLAVQQSKLAPNVNQLLGGPNQMLWEEISSPTECTFRRVDPRNSSIVLAHTRRLAKGRCVGASLGSAGQRIYVETNSAEPGFDTLYEIRAMNGSIVSHVNIAQLAQFVSIAAQGNGVWIAGGDPGVGGAMQYLTISPLRLVDVSNPFDVNLDPNNLHNLPQFGQFPVVNISRDAVWVSSDGVLACFDPSNGQTLATVQQPKTPIITNTFAVVDGFTWADANYSSPGPGVGLALIHPPDRCFAR